MSIWLPLPGNQQVFIDLFLHQDAFCARYNTIRRIRVYIVSSLCAMAPFHLLRLPSVALDEVLKTMCLLELIQLASVSKKIQRFIKITLSTVPIDMVVAMRQGNIILTLNAGATAQPLEFAIDCETSFGELRDLQIDGIRMQVRVDTDASNITNYMIHAATLQRLLNHFGKMFKDLTVSVCDRDNDRDKWHYLTKFFEKYKPKIDDMSLYDNGAKTELTIYKQFLAASKTARKIFIEAKSEPAFLYDPDEKLLVTNHVNVNITPATWVTTENIKIFGNCCSLILYETQFNSEDLNMILKDWMEAPASPLVVLSLEAAESIDEDLVFKDLPVRAIEDEVVKGFMPREPTETRYRLGEHAAIFIDDKFLKFHNLSKMTNYN